MSPFPKSIWQSPAAKWHFILPTTTTSQKVSLDIHCLFQFNTRFTLLDSQVKFYSIPNKAWSPEWDLYDDAFNEEVYRAALQRNADIPPRTQPQPAWEQSAVVRASADSDLDSDSESTHSDSDEQETDSVKHSDLTTESDSDSDDLHTMDELRTVYHGMNSS